ncbi:FAD-dependent oxidoreductase [Sphingomonas parva]|uniref:FAD-dependent oxidoreductase n=1 Tax=Sphingomonas parva TaxID=2555898 RepID=UPI0014308C2A|nr:FAD-dependent oxidoreductase [Sphingomonas parva]
MAGGAAVVGAPSLAAGDPQAVIVGAGVFGTWTAIHLQRAGWKVLLVDAWGPAHARASSGGESRMTRASYGADEIYSRMARDSLPEWRALSARAELPLFHAVGVLFLFGAMDAYVRNTIEVHRRLGLATRLFERAEIGRRFPQFDLHGVELGLFEPAFGALMARRAVQTLVSEFVAAGGAYRQARILPPTGHAGPLERLALAGGETLSADRFVFACGPWLAKLFPALLGRRIFPTRQEVFFLAPPAGDRSFSPAAFPGWADFNDGDIFYGFPDLEGRGVKIAHDRHGPPIDPDIVDRLPSAEALAEARDYAARRFPALAGARLNESRVCQYENSANGDLLIDWHPDHPDTLLVGAGSGHGFKHGPAVGACAARLLLDRDARPEPRFAMAAKAERQDRRVH